MNYDHSCCLCLFNYFCIYCLLFSADGPLNLVMSYDYCCCCAYCIRVMWWLFVVCLDCFYTVFLHYFYVKRHFITLNFCSLIVFYCKQNCLFMLSVYDERNIFLFDMFVFFTSVLFDICILSKIVYILLVLWWKQSIIFDVR